MTWPVRARASRPKAKASFFQVIFCGLLPEGVAQTSGGSSHLKWSNWENSSQACPAALAQVDNQDQLLHGLTCICAISALTCTTYLMKQYPSDPFLPVPGIRQILQVYHIFLDNNSLHEHLSLSHWFTSVLGFTRRWESYLILLHLPHEAWGAGMLTVAPKC